MSFNIYPWKGDGRPGSCTNSTGSGRQKDTKGVSCDKQEEILTGISKLNTSASGEYQQPGLQVI